MLISISGFHGTGKTTIAKEVAAEFNLEYIAAGDVFRQMAEEKQMSLKEFSKYVEQHPEIDHEIDKRTIEAAKKGNAVLDGLLAAWMTRDFFSIDILFITDENTRIQRIAQREGRSFKEVKDETLSREESEVKRFLNLYNINLNDYSIYDIVLNTGLWSQEAVIRIVIMLITEYVKSNQKGDENFGF